MALRTVLVVDDSHTDRLFLTELLEQQGLQVRTAGNAEEAYARLAEARPDLILMDVVMPGTNGYQLTRTIGRDPRYGDIPIILCTVRNQATDRLWGLRQGARACISKPANRAELLAAMDTVR
ncbi:MAG: response regulator [Burkholderiaceae bacterium]|nr:response regulator [Burkholderiaceae bacterium]